MRLSKRELDKRINELLDRLTDKQSYRIIFRCFETGKVLRVYEPTAGETAVELTVRI